MSDVESEVAVIDISPGRDVQRTRKAQDWLWDERSGALTWASFIQEKCKSMVFSLSLSLCIYVCNVKQQKWLFQMKSYMKRQYIKNIQKRLFYSEGGKSFNKLPHQQLLRWFCEILGLLRAVWNLVVKLQEENTRQTHTRGPRAELGKLRCRVWYEEVIKTIERGIWGWGAGQGEFQRQSGQWCQLL